MQSRHPLAIAGLSLLFLSTTALAAPQRLLTRHVPNEADAAHFVAALPDTQRLRLAITLPLHHEAALDRLLDSVSDPRSPAYRHYLTVAEFTDRYGPTAAEYAALHRFAAQHGLDVKADYPNRFVMDVEAPASAIRAAFGVTLGIYRHSRDGRLFYAPDREPTMDIGIPVLHISGLDNAEPPAPHGLAHGVKTHAVQANGSGPSGNYIASDMRAAYAGNTTLNGSGQIVALVEFEGYNITDIKNYFTTLDQTLSVSIVGISVDGTKLSCVYPKCDDTEAAIDIEQTIGMAPGLKQVSFYLGSTVIDILNRIATDNTAAQISSSYGWPAEPTVEDPVYKEFLAQGQTFVDGSGDDGSDLPAGGVWPADDQYVTGVGATNLTTKYPGGPWESESCWADSGGGPSPDGIAIPRWQKPFVNSQNHGSTTLRNVPDVAMEGAYDNYACLDLSCSNNWGGTSFAAPRWAAYTALINQQAALSKLEPIGTLNRVLYALSLGPGYGENLHDITGGNNGGYSCVTGYDLVSGLGSPQPALIPSLAKGLRFR
jgi:subtilase family serine protease